MSFLCYKIGMEKQTKELDEDIFKEVMKIWRQERAKALKKQAKARKKNENKKS